MANNSIPVLIAGAGPVGLSMALELKRRGIAFRIIDKQIKPVKTSNATVAQTRTLELWDDMGILQTALDLGHKLTGLNLYSGKERLFHVGDPGEIDSLYQFVLGIPQRNTESMLHNYLRGQGVNIEMEVELTSCTEQENGVSATLRHKDGREETVQADWLVGCDGIRSIVREQLKIDFSGKQLDEHFIVADLKLKSKELSPDEVNTFLAPDGPVILIPIDEGFTRIVAEVTYDPDVELRTSRTPSNEQVKNVLKNRVPFSLELADPVWTSGFWITEKMVNTYQSKRVFLAGDACHVHAPLGGQGMNTGIQDVYNLAWKLALVSQGKAKKELLESYQKERFDIAKAVLTKTTFLTHALTLRNSFLRYIRNKIISFFMSREKNRKIFMATVSELAVNYKHSPIVKDQMPSHSEGPVAGTRFLDVRLAEGRLFDFIRGTHATLMLFAGPNTNKDTYSKLLALKKKVNQRFSDNIKVLFITPSDNVGEFGAQGETIVDHQQLIHKKYGADQACLYFIRPDKYIGFRGHLDFEDDLMRYLEAIYV